jgi:hypothetical protein
MTTRRPAPGGNLAKLDQATLAQFSPRARKILGGVRREPPPARDAIIRRLKDLGRPVSDAVIDFEQRLGGVRFELGVAGSRQTFKLGIAWHAPRLASDDPQDPERTMVPIGSTWNGYLYLYMDARGEVTGYFDTVLTKSSSIVRYLEREVLLFTPRWGRPRFAVDLRPALGADLARALELHPVEEASDAYEAWWTGPGLVVQQVLFQGSWKAARTVVRARSLSGVSRVLETARSLDRGLMVSVDADPCADKRPTRKQRMRAPSLESWASTPGAVRYRFGNEDAHLSGVVWLIPEGRAHIIQQYRCYRDQDGEELFSWDTFDASGGTSRGMDG